MAAWIVDSVTPSTDIVPGGGVTEGVRVTFTTESGVTGHVFVPSHRVSDSDAIREMISQKADQLESIRNLSG